MIVGAGGGQKPASFEIPTYFGLYSRFGLGMMPKF
jgi:radical SAM superfamily enzyme with C-terminal helix-hairpin-helix motif